MHQYLTAAYLLVCITAVNAQSASKDPVPALTRLPEKGIAEKANYGGYGPDSHLYWKPNRQMLANKKVAEKAQKTEAGSTGPDSWMYWKPARQLLANIAREKAQVADGGSSGPWMYWKQVKESGKAVKDESTPNNFDNPKKPTGPPNTTPKKSPGAAKCTGRKAAAGRGHALAAVAAASGSVASVPSTTVRAVQQQQALVKLADANVQAVVITPTPEATTPAGSTTQAAAPQPQQQQQQQAPTAADTTAAAATAGKAGEQEKASRTGTRRSNGHSSHGKYHSGPANYRYNGGSSRWRGSNRYAVSSSWRGAAYAPSRAYGMQIGKPVLSAAIHSDKILLCAHGNKAYSCFGKK